MFNFYIDALIIAVFGIILSLLFRKKIANIKSKNKPYTRYLYWTFILIVIEELVSCTPGSGCPFYITVPVIFALSTIYGFAIKKIKLKSVFRSTILFMGVGLLFELIIGAHNAEFASLRTFEKIIIFSWVALSYAFMMIIPATILINREQKQ